MESIRNIHDQNEIHVQRLSVNYDIRLKTVSIVSRVPPKPMRFVNFDRERGNGKRET